MAFPNTPFPARQPGDKPIERAIARKLWVGEVLSGELVVTAGLNPNVLKTVRGDVGRVNIIGIVVSTEELPVSSILIDDGTGSITVRSFDRALMTTVGDIVQVIGRPRIYQGALYVAAEAVVRIDAGWAAYRKREIGDAIIVEKPIEVEPAPNNTEASLETNAERILKIIMRLDRGEGAPVEEVIIESQIRDAEAIIEQLLMSGDIFEIRAGKVKVL